MQNRRRRFCKWLKGTEMAKLKKKPVEGAPMYMGQFASLMTIMLAFFIALLTLGKEKVATFRVGLGMVQTAFGLDAGDGMLQFIKMLMPAKPAVEEESAAEQRFFLGYEKGTFQQRRFDLDRITGMELQALKQVVRVATPITFAPAETAIEPASQVFLDRFATVLRSMPERMVTVACYSSTGSGGADQVIAAQRASAIVRYLAENGRVPAERLLPMGYCETRYLGDFATGDSRQATLFFMSSSPAKTGL